jgi:N-hydroxyarylamine O-acetyltransferase
MHDAAAIDLDAYLARIGHDGPRGPTSAVLRAVQEAHATRIPFENLDLMLGRPIRVDLPAIEAKLVAARRGGYCFEHNLLLAAALSALGFEVTLLLARVRVDPPRVVPRTHLVLRVRPADAGDMIADAGFGADGLLHPVPLDAAETVTVGHWSWRLEREGDIHVMRSARAGRWRDLYAFSLEPQLAVDVEVANHYVSTHPESRFLHTLTAQRMTRDARWTLRNRELIVDRGTSLETRALASRADVLRTLAREFGLPLDADAPLRIPD